MSKGHEETIHRQKMQMVTKYVKTLPHEWAKKYVNKNENDVLVFMHPINKNFLKISNNNAGNGTVGWTLLMHHYEVAQVSEGNFTLCIKALNCPHFVT